jgi:hypothetical protein
MTEPLGPRQSGRAVAAAAAGASAALLGAATAQQASK